MKPPYVEKGNYIFFSSGPFSQWYKASFKAPDGREFCCCEQYMMAAKALAFHDDEALKEIMATKNPRKQKEIGRKINGFDPGKWDAVKNLVVFYGNYLKFSQNEDLWKILDGTGDKVIAEAAPWDSIWGIGMQVEDPMILDSSIWGENLLGRALMEVRKALRSSASEE